MNTEMDRDGEIAELKAGALAAIASINQHLAVLEQQGKPSRNPISNHISVYDYAVMYVSLF